MAEIPQVCDCAPRGAEHNAMSASVASELTAQAALVAFARLATGVVHEVNNPLGVALSSAQLALRHLPSSAPPQHVRCLERVVESVRAASTAIREMLQVSSNCSPNGRTQVFDVRDVLRFVTTAMQGAAEERGCAVTWSVAPESSQISGNPLAIEIVIASLVYRAIESGATKVELNSHVRGDWLDVVIEDDAMGHGASSAETADIGLIEQIVRDHDGELNFQVTKDGRRSILRFRVHVDEERRNGSY